MFLRITFTNFDLNTQPGFWEGEFLDAFGKKHVIIDKIPIIFEKYDEKNFPQEGFLIPGEIIERKGNRVLFSLCEPFYITSKEGETDFYVFEDQLNDKPLLLR